MIKILALTLLSTLAAAQAPCTGFKCSASTAQFTVLGEITAVDQTTPPNTASNYTARMDIKCAYASFTNPPSRLISANQNVLVKDFGTFEGKCGSGGSDAKVGDKKIYFLYVDTKVQSTQASSYAVYDICTGGHPASQENLQILSDLLRDNPTKSIMDGDCQLPPSTVIPTATGTGGSSINTDTPTTKSDAKQTQITSLTLIAGTAALIFLGF